MKNVFSVDDRLERLARAYTPEWRFTHERPDAGSVIALLIGRMLADSEQRLDRALHKHHIQFMNLFDGIVPEPLESARSFVRFTPVASVSAPVHVPAGTRLSANAGDTQVLFETAHGITATGAKLRAVYASDRANDRIVRLAPDGDDPDADAGQTPFTAFGTQGRNESGHLLQLWFEDTFDSLDRLDVTLAFSAAAGGSPQELADELCGEGMRFFFVGEAGEEPFDTVRSEDGGIRLIKEDCRPLRQAFGPSRSGFLIGLRADRPRPLQIASVRMRMGEENLLPDTVTCGGVTQNIGHFLPFGAPMEIYAECAMDNVRVLSKKGARVTMSFDVSQQVERRRLPEYEESTDYRLVMKKPQLLPQPMEEEVHAQSVLIEYWSTRGWRRLNQAEHETLYWDGSVSGPVSFSFLCPDDLIPVSEAGGQPRLRLRLMRADNLYRMPCVQYCPVMDNLRFSYTFGEEGRLPDRICTWNLYESADITERLRAGEAAVPFYNNEALHPAMYLGFDASPAGMPLSLYWNIENNADRPVEFMAQYESPEGFVPVKVMDGTGGMLHSGLMLLAVPEDARREKRFGQELYWLRLIRHGEGEGELPHVSGITLNMARVENVNTRTERFYLEDPDAALHIQLDTGSLIRVRVWVNEHGDPPESGHENWVEWRVESRPGARGGQRVCRADLRQGTVDFRRGALAQAGVRPDGAAVRVEYQSYQGAAANVAAGEIRTLIDSVRFISAADNPFPAYGGRDGGSERAMDGLIASTLRTRRRVVGESDYFDLITQSCQGVRRIRCCQGVGRSGEPEEDAVTVAVLLDEYEKGSHIFSAMKEELYRQLYEHSSLSVLGKRLILTQPHFVEVSVRLWIEYADGPDARMENLYDLQKQVIETIETFLSPLRGGFEGNGWEIGELPTVSKLLAQLKIRHPGLVVTRMVETARFAGKEYTVDDDIGRWIHSPFAMAVSGKHRVYVQV